MDENKIGEYSEREKAVSAIVFMSNRNYKPSISEDEQVMILEDAFIKLGVTKKEMANGSIHALMVMKGVIKHP